MTTVDTFLSAWGQKEKPEQSPLVNPRAHIFNNLLVELSKSARDDNTVRINHIKSLKRQSGELKKFLQWITAEASKNKFTLTMAVQPCTSHFEESVPKEKLKEVARRYGFEVRFEYPDKLGYEMYKKP